MWFTYIVRCQDDSLYTGSTNDITRRFIDHLEGRGARYTKSHKPVKVVYIEEFPTQSAAFKREAEIKKLKKTKKEVLVKKINF